MNLSREARRLARVGVGALLLAVGVSGCGGSTAQREPGLGEPASSVAPDAQVITMGLAAPWSIVFFGRTPLVSERDSGRVLEIIDDGRTRVVGTVDGVDDSGEAGLLGLAVRGRTLYAYYTTAAGQNRIVRRPIVGAPGALTLGPPRIVLDGIPAAAYHDGGRIAFGPDGMLYVGTGDAGQPKLAQDLDSPAGKILRMTPAGDAPPDNPFPGSLVYSLGHRNVQGFAWAPDGTMFASEFGANRADELNRIEPGQNYGWPAVEGVGRSDRYVNPLQTWTPDEASPSGIAVIGRSIVIANLRGERIRVVPLADPSTGVDHYAGEFGRLRDVVAAPDGSVWILTNNTDGRGTPGAGDDRIIRIKLDSGAG